MIVLLDIQPKSISRIAEFGDDRWMRMQRNEVSHSHPGKKLSSSY